jgi:hypothetical protein
MLDFGTDFLLRDYIQSRLHVFQYVSISLSFSLYGLLIIGTFTVRAPFTESQFFNRLVS